MPDGCRLSPWGTAPTADPRDCKRGARVTRRTGHNLFSTSRAKPSASDGLGVERRLNEPRGTAEQTTFGTVWLRRGRLGFGRPGRLSFVRGKLPGFSKR